MDHRLVAQLKNYVVSQQNIEDKPEPHIDYHKIHQASDQLANLAKIAIQSGQYVCLEDMDRLCQIGDVLQKELYHVRQDLMRRKNLELHLPSPNTQHHLPCSSLLSPSSTPSSPSSQQSMAMSTGASTGLISPSSTPTGSPSSPHGMGLSDSNSMAITSTGIMQSDEFWRRGKIDPTKIVRRSPTPLYVNLTEQMILAQSSKRKRPAEGDLYCHNCKTKDTPEWRRGPMGAKTLCNACGIRWRLSQAEAQKQKNKGDLSPPSPSSSPLAQYPLHQLAPPSPPQPTTPLPSQLSPTASAMTQSILQQQMRYQQHQQQMLLQQQSIQHQYNQSHAQHAHPAQQHMVLPGHVGLAQENTNGTRPSPNVISSLMTSPIAT